MEVLDVAVTEVLPDDVGVPGVSVGYGAQRTGAPEATTIARMPVSQSAV